MSWHSGTSFDPPHVHGLPVHTPTSTSLVQSPAQDDGSPSLHQQQRPTSSRHESSIEDSNGRKRKRSSMVDGGDEAVNDSLLGSPSLSNSGRNRHQPGVKRACNDCRQQKLRCNVVAGPPGEFKACNRCIKHNLECSIDSEFKRLGKRAQHEEMARELEACRQKLSEYEAMGFVSAQKPAITFNGAYSGSSSAAVPAARMSGAPYLGPSEAAASRSLLDLSQGFRELPPTSMPSITPGTTIRTLSNVTISEEHLKRLFEIYFISYHPFLPVVSPDLMTKDMRLDAYYNLHPLLHWTMVATAARRFDQRPGLLVELQSPLNDMLWTTLSQVPQTYHVCKALALLCSWPLPNSSTSQESTMMLAGVMFQLAMQYGLHRPSHAQDFSRFRIDLREEDITDRLNTWATVNIVSQNVATGLGQPPLSRWAWYTYGLHLDRMKRELDMRCRVEKFIDTVTRTIFTMQRDHIVEVDEAHRGLSIDMYARELGELEITLLSNGATQIELIYLKAASLHLRLSAFFDKPTQPNYLADLRNVYIAATSMLTAIVDLPSTTLLYVPRYVEQMVLAAAVTLLKLLNSFFASHVDVPVGRTLFSRSVNTLRQLSVRSNDLPQRLAEVMAQLWHTSGASDQRLFSTTDAAHSPDDSLQLKVRCRSSLSVLYDAIWRWRQQVGQTGTQHLDQAVDNPTHVPTNSHGANTPNPATTDPTLGIEGGLAVGDVDPLAWDGSYGSNAVFDPLSWALDGDLNFTNFGGADGLGF
ncbi:hypothetical protein B0A48_01142 [Cryoendolithus antarcticus]|uniref:Zn(2)-C6 fungal-type domain-containing protein n=1 Tax=Cryoendolithus antarcticus TaxID=1507870 RepID=A0A1V8TSC3_9PEZI|nr:hypothetical protein B0A48_01142 [Cryoendolithus antarcticus]